MRNLNYNISTIYPTINMEMFKGDFMIQIDSGWIYNNNLVYLDLSDLNMLWDLGKILDFYRNLNREGKVYRIKLLNSTPVYEDYMSSCIRPTCVKCLSLSDDLCINNECVKCHNFLSKNTFVNYSRPVIARFNMYEWIPIKGYLENRNINSHLFKRKLMIIYDGDCIQLKLLDSDINTIDCTYDTVKLLDKLYRIFDMFNVPLTLEKTIIGASVNLIDKKLYCNDAVLLDIIISNPNNIFLIV